MNTAIIMIIIVSVIRLSVPIIITGLGNIFCEKSGVMNLGAEGMMISGAFGAAAMSYFSGNVWIGILFGVGCGLSAAAILALVGVELGGAQNIGGLGLNTLAVGLTSFFCRVFFGSGKSPVVPSAQSMPVLSKIPVIGEFLAQFSPILYILIILYLICWYVIKKSVAGLRITAVGDNPQTVETAGINVWKLRWLCVLACGALAGLGGAYLSVGQLNIFVEDMTMGKGMLTVIAVKMGRWDPKLMVLIALMFGFFDAVQLQLQIYNVFNLPVEIIQTIPYIMGILAIAFDRKREEAPKQLMRPYVKNRFKA